MATWFTLSDILLAFFLRSSRLAFVRKSHCPWCWKTLHLMRWYPRRWSTTICGHHARQLRAQSAARRAHRLALARTAIGMTPVQAEEEPA